jgi:hypothetical protein
VHVRAVGWVVPILELDRASIYKTGHTDEHAGSGVRDKTICRGGDKDARIQRFRVLQTKVWIC